MRPGLSEKTGGLGTINDDPSGRRNPQPVISVAAPPALVTEIEK
jgi:hypothetical protein